MHWSQLRQVVAGPQTYEGAASQSAENAGNKEVFWDGEPKPSVSPPAGSPYENAQKHRRFQIYVHSKLMIVDDEVGLSLCFCHTQLTSSCWVHVSRGSSHSP